MPTLFHQEYNSVGAEVYKINIFRDTNFELHMHKSCEFVYLYSGSTTFVVGQKEYSIEEGQSLLLQPYQIHSSKDSQNAVILIVSFPLSQVHTFATAIEKMVPNSPFFVLSPKTRDYVLNCIFGDFVPNDRIIKHPVPDALTSKGMLYAICADYMKQITLTRTNMKSESLFSACLAYIEKNYTENITLNDIAQYLNYDYSYLSRYFHEVFGISFKTLVNQYRCERASVLISTTHEKMSDIALQCGFQNIRSFNRIFKLLMGRTPIEYKKYASRKDERKN